MTHHTSLPGDSSLSEDRNPVDVLADEFASRLRSGESPSMQEYVEQYPEYAEQIQELFPGVALLEQLSEKHDSEASFQQRPRQDGLPPGHRFGDIEIVHEVGRGGMGIVYEGYQHSLNRSVAVKALSVNTVHSAKQATRFKREAQAAAQLHHTNIVPVFGVGEQDGTSYYVMQLIHGLGLDAILAELVRKTHGQKSESSIEAISPGQSAGSSLSARGFADVLVSGQLSESAVRTLGGATSISAPIQPDPEDALTVLCGDEARKDGQTVLDHRAENRTEDRTGDMGCEETPQTFVRSSLELRDESSPSRSVRSSLVLRDELPDGETFAAPDEATPEEVTEDPSLASLGPRYWRNIARIGLQVASGLHYAHSQGTLHRDIKPANILLDTDGIAWIADFGLAKLLQQEDVTKTGDVVGTLRYMAPEQFRGETDARSDLYSFGLTLYELLTLRPAYDDTDRQQLIARKLTPHDPTHPRKYHHGIPRDLETIVLKCLAWEPDRRYRSAGALVAELQAFLEDRPIQARPISVVERFGRWYRRQPLVAGLSTAVLLLMMTTLMLLGVLYFRADRRAQEMHDLNLAAERASAREEQATELIWQALEEITEALVPERFTGPVDASAEVEEDGEVETESTATVLSPQSAAILERLLPTFDKIAEIRGTDPRDVERTANATRKLGELNLQLGEYSAAADAFERAIELYRQFEESLSPTQDTSLMLARCYNGLSVAEDHRNQRFRARSSLQHSLRVLGRPVLDQDDPTVRFERASTHYLMAEVPPLESPRDGREDGFRSGRSGSGRLGGRGTNDERRPPAVALRGNAQADSQERQRGRVFRRFGRRPNYDYSVSQQDLRTAIQILDPLIAEFPSVSEYQFLLALCHIELSDRRIGLEQSVRLERLAEAIEILEDLVAENPTEPDYRYQLSEAYEERFYLWRNTPHPYRSLFWQDLLVQDPQERTDLSGIANVQADLERAVNLSTELLQQQPNVPRYPRSHARLLFNLADVYAGREEWTKARELLADVTILRNQLAQKFPESPPRRRRGASSYDVLLGYVLVRSQKHEEAQQLMAPLTETVPEEPGYYDAAAYAVLARALEALGESTEAAAALQEARRLKEERDRRWSPGSSGSSQDDSSDSPTG